MRSGHPHRERTHDQDRAPRHVIPKEGIRKHGDARFVATVNNTYRLENAGHVRSAWRYITQERNASTYDRDDVEFIKERIMNAAVEFGVAIDSDTVD